MPLFIQRSTGQIFSGNADQLSKRADLEPYNGPLPGQEAPAKTDVPTAGEKETAKKTTTKKAAAEPVVAPVAEPAGEPVATITATLNPAAGATQPNEPLTLEQIMALQPAEQSAYMSSLDEDARADMAQQYAAMQAAVTPAADTSAENETTAA